jgi:hypothetical protein
MYFFVYCVGFFPLTPESQLIVVNILIRITVKYIPAKNIQLNIDVNTLADVFSLWQS